jgi:XTP/dITP diphosphohydrolase
MMSEKQRIVLASGNKGKIREISGMLKGYEVIGYKELGIDIEIEENGSTFYENALIKAKTISDMINLPVLADDSGLMVEALGGAPGIYSARYAGDGIDEHNNQKLLEVLKGEKNRNAKFVCSMVLYFPNGKILSAYGETKGEILQSPQGEEGFGYDPLFYSLDLNKSLGIASLKKRTPFRIGLGR